MSTAAPPGKPDKKKRGPAAGDGNRGTQDELEILALIVQENVGVRIQVAEKLRQAKGRMAVREKANAKKLET